MLLWKFASASSLDTMSRDLNTYWLEVSGYSDDPWWMELYIDFEFSRLHFGSHPIVPLNDNEAPPHAD